MNNAESEPANANFIISIISSLFFTAAYTTKKSAEILARKIIFFIPYIGCSETNKDANPIRKKTARIKKKKKKKKKKREKKKKGKFSLGIKPADIKKTLAISKAISALTGVKWLF